MSQDEKAAVFAAFEAGRITGPEFFAIIVRSHLSALAAVPEPDAEMLRNIASCWRLVMHFEAQQDTPSPICLTVH
jgi:hypothetical protein